MIETMFLYQRSQFRAEAAGMRGFMHDHATSGLFHRRNDGRQIQRPDTAQVDNFDINTALFRGGFRNKYHGAVGQHGQGRAFAIDRCAF